MVQTSSRNQYLSFRMIEQKKKFKKLQIILYDFTEWKQNLMIGFPFQFAYILNPSLYREIMHKEHLQVILTLRTQNLGFN